MRRVLYILLLAAALVTTTNAAGQEDMRRVRRLPTTGVSPTLNSRTNATQTTLDSVFRDSTATNTELEYNTEVPDSVLRKKVFFFRYRPTRIWIDRLWCPTLDPTGAQYHDPLDALNGNYYLGKGTLGHQHIGIFPTLADGLGLQLQPNGYEGYYLTPRNIYLYQTLTPYTMLSYGSSLNKDYNVRVSHTQNIMPGWNVALNYRLFSPEGVYTSSGAVTNYLDATTNYFSPDSRLQATAGIIWHKFRIDENGGLADDDIFTQRTQTNRAGIPVNLNGTTQQKDLAAFGRATYSLTRQSISLRHRDSLSVHQVNDSTTAIDTIDVVDTIPLRRPKILNAGVVGIELNIDRRKRVFQDSTYWIERAATLFWTNDAYPEHRWRNPLKVTLGVSPRTVNTVIEGDTLQMASLFDPFARIELAIWRGTLTLEGNLQGNFGHEPTPDSRIAATLDYPFDGERTTYVSLSAVAQRQAPDVRLLHDASVNQNLQLTTLGTERYRLRFAWREYIDLDMRTNHLNHNTWYNSAGLVVEGEHPLWLSQAALTLRIAAGPIHLDMQQLVQHTTDSVQMPVPLWASKNSLYADFTLFNHQLRVQFGVDARYHTPYYAPTYDPYTGLFRHQQSTLVGGYLWGDVFLNLQVKRASIYVKAGHLNALWEDKPNYFLLPHYPGQRFGLFWGITWCFFD